MELNGLAVTLIFDILDRGGQVKVKIIVWCRPALLQIKIHYHFVPRGDDPQATMYA